MVEITITNSPELNWNMITDLHFHDDGKIPTDEKNRIREAYKEIDSMFLDPFQLMDIKNYVSEKLNVEKDILTVDIFTANSCRDCG